MSSDYLIKIDGINGESKDKDFKDYIEVFGWSFSAQAPMDAISRQRTGKTVVSDLTLVKAIDKSSVTLIERCVRNNNQPKDKATLICRKAGGKQYGFFQIDLKKVRVRSVNTKAPETPGLPPVEIVVLTYQEIEWTYREQMGDGQLKGEIVTSHDVAQNV